MRTNQASLPCNPLVPRFRTAAWAVSAALLAWMSVAAGSAVAQPAKSATGTAHKIHPYFFDSKRPLPRIGATFDLDPKKFPYLLEPARGLNPVPPYGKLVDGTFKSAFSKAGIPGAVGAEGHPKFDLVATIRARPLLIRETRDGLWSQTSFDLAIRDIDGAELESVAVVAQASRRGRFGTPVPEALEDAARQAVAILKDSERLERLIVSRVATGTGAKSLRDAGLKAFRAGRHQVAFWCFDRSLRLAPNHQGAWTYRAAALTKLGFREDATRSFKRAMEIAPDSAEADQARKWLEAM